tara:strand:+ start:120 stop:2333 length:2214 start_codon:yes stop_codon:yes gene_type:complete
MLRELNSEIIMNYNISEYPEILFTSFKNIENESYSPSGQHKALLNFSEKFVFYLAGVLLGEYKKSGVINKNIEAELYNYSRRHPSFGQVWGFVRLLCTEVPDSIIKKVITSKENRTSYSELVDTFEQLTKMVNDEVLSEFSSYLKETTNSNMAFSSAVDCIIQIRNKNAHPELKGKTYSWPLNDDFFDCINPVLLNVLNDFLGTFGAISKYLPVTIKSHIESNNAHTGHLNIGKIGTKIDIAPSQTYNGKIIIDETYLIDFNNNIFSKFYFNNFPGPSPEVAKEILKDQKTKELLPHLEAIIKDKLLNDSKMDSMEYMVIKDFAKNVSIDESELFNVINRIKNKLNIKFDVGTPENRGDLFIETKQNSFKAKFNVWWLNYFGMLGNYKKEILEDEKSSILKYQAKLEIESNTNLLKQKQKYFKEYLSQLTKKQTTLKASLGDKRNKLIQEIQELSKERKELTIQISDLEQLIESGKDLLLEQRNNTLWGMHQSLWEDITMYLEEVCSESINKNFNNSEGDETNDKWVNSVANWQQGELSHYYWARIHPETAPLGKVFNIGYIVSKNPKKKLLSKMEIHSTLESRVILPSTWVYLTANGKELRSFDTDNALQNKYSQIQTEWINENKEELLKNEVNIRCFDISSVKPVHQFIPIKYYLENPSNKTVYWTYSKIWNRHDFLIDGKISQNKMQKYQSEITAYIQMFSNVIRKMNDYALENNINQETIKEKKNMVKRLEIS